MLLVSELLERLQQCGSAVLQAVSVLQGTTGGQGARQAALEVLRGLPCTHQEAVSAEEVLAVDVVVAHMQRVIDLRHTKEAAAGSSNSIRVSACMGLFTLGCRNGVAVCGSKDLLKELNRLLLEAMTSVSEVVSEVVNEGISGPDGDTMARSHRRFAPSLSHFMPESLTDSVPLSEATMRPNPR